jgi:hypothetical protein
VDTSLFNTSRVVDQIRQEEMASFAKITFCVGGYFAQLYLFNEVVANFVAIYRQVSASHSINFLHSLCRGNQLGFKICMVKAYENIYSDICIEQLFLLHISTRAKVTG